jgi:hypothetical protein
MEIEQRYLVVFFAGGETRDNKFNVFTGSFIRFLSLILEDNFRLIKGIYLRYPALNVIWALNNVQKPLKNPEKSKIASAALKQLIPETKNNETILIILSSSSGSIVAAQTACYLAEENMKNNYYLKPFHLVLGTNFISKKSDLYLRLLEYRKSGIIGTIIFDELQDEGDSIYETGGLTRAEAWSNAIGLMFPVFSSKFKGPSFLNTDPVTGHLHRRRSQTVKKAMDFIEVIFIRNKIAGEDYCNKAISVIDAEKQHNTIHRLQSVFPRKR